MDEKTICLQFILFYMDVPYQMFFMSVFLIYFIYGLVFMGVVSNVPKYVYMWNFGVQVALCLFLMIRYFPLRKQHRFEAYDAKLIFAASTLLFINLISIPILLMYWNQITSHVSFGVAPKIDAVPVKTLSLADFL
jgi:hypothetical protein